MGVGDKRVAVSFDKLGKHVKDQPMLLNETKAALQSAPAFVYEADDSTASIVSPETPQSGSSAPR
jgi:hypothetical protein